MKTPPEKPRQSTALPEIRTPVFEATELFRRGVGDTTDVVQKEMYSFTDRDGRSMTLRPEGTASLARSIIESGKCAEAMPLKLFYIINCFRYEKPQAGRSREFWQFGSELYGAPTPEADAEIISLADDFLHTGRAEKRESAYQFHRLQVLPSEIPGSTHRLFLLPKGRAVRHL